MLDAFPGAPALVAGVCASIVANALFLLHMQEKQKPERESRQNKRIYVLNFVTGAVHSTRPCVHAYV